MKVVFNSPEEFIAELHKGHPDNKILRITRRFQRSNLPIQHLSIIATYVNHAGEIVQLTHYCGDLWGNSPADTETNSRAETVIAQLEKVAKELQFDVRSGVYENVNENTNKNKGT